SDVRLLQAATSSPALAGAALDALGALGDPSGVPAILEAMARLDTAEPALAAFTRIVGPVDARMPRQPPNVAADGDDDFHDLPPPPDPERARTVWEQRRGAMPPRTRWQAGIDVTTIDLDTALRTLSLRDRRDHWLRQRTLEPRTTPDLELERRVRD